MSYEAQIYFKIVFQISSRLFPPKPPTWPTMHSPSNIGINYCMVYLSKFAVSYEKRKYILEGGESKSFVLPALPFMVFEEECVL